MKYLLLLSCWLAFAAIASAQCPNGNCPQRYATYVPPYRIDVPVPAPVVYAVPVGTVYVERTRYVGPVRRLFGCR